MNLQQVIIFFSLIANSCAVFSTAGALVVKAVYMGYHQVYSTSHHTKAIPKLNLIASKLGNEGFKENGF